MMEKGKTEDSALKKLQQLVIDEKMVGLAKENLDDPALIDAQVRIEKYDRFVTSTVAQVITGEEPDIVSTMYDPDLDSELNALHENKDGHARQLVEQYLQYKHRLDQMLDLAMQVLHERRP